MNNRKAGLRTGVKTICLILAFALYAIGIATFYKPLFEAKVNTAEKDTVVKTYLEKWEELREPVISPSEAAGAEETVPDYLPDLYQKMQEYNRTLYENGQATLCDPWSYKQESFDLSADYGIEDDVFGVLDVPAMNESYPIYLGATFSNMLRGVGHMSNTSLPIGGINTTCVIAGHRGWYDETHFKYIENIQLGDEFTITNPWEVLTYRTIELRVVDPYEVESILIQEGKDLVILLTCHPYGTGGRMRYLVIAERVLPEEEDQIVLTEKVEHQQVVITQEGEEFASSQGSIRSANITRCIGILMTIITPLVIAWLLFPHKKKAKTNRKTTDKP